MLPFDPRSLRAAGYAEIQRIIRMHEPPKPSTRISALRSAAQTPPRRADEPVAQAPGHPAADARGSDSPTVHDIARRRGTDPASLHRQLRGDLDWIVMKALEKDRTRRYGTAAEFAADVERCLSLKPAFASPPSATYRLRKFIRRRGGRASAAVGCGGHDVDGVGRVTRARVGGAGPQ
ncbi:MAG: hypothetical protein IH986_17310 [Planctomycetes bacterium]|nr:hypothetical protein [Planctomycetota bacterium]